MSKLLYQYFFHWSYFTNKSVGEGLFTRSRDTQKQFHHKKPTPASTLENCKPGALCEPCYILNVSFILQFEWSESSPPPRSVYFFVIAQQDTSRIFQVPAFPGPSQSNYFHLEGMLQFRGACCTTSSGLPKWPLINHQYECINRQWIKF